MSGFTKGPWTFDGDAIKAAGERLLLVGVSLPMTHGPAMDEAKANARLIAEAPDLLFLARKVAEHFENTDAPLGILARGIIERVEGK